MKENQTSYRQIMKATSLFGGVQVFNIGISIVRSKFVAVLLGPAGMGIVGLLQSTIDLISSLTNFGLRTSAVKDIAEAVGTNNLKRVAIVVTVLRRLVWGTGLFGALITFITAPWLSQLTFGNKEYSGAFMWLSITLLLNQLSSGQSIVLQGFRKLKLLATSSVLGSFLSLFITVPLYYYYGVKGIVSVIIITSSTTLLLTWYFSRKVQLDKVKVSTTKTITEGKSMITMGFMISLSGLLTVVVSYLVRIYISNSGGVDDVGLYSAGFAIIGTYVGLVFSAMGTDFFPRLSGISHNNQKAKLLINQQAEIALLILTPILIVFIIFIKWVVIILYSTKFVPIIGMIHWAALGMFFKAVSWSIGFIMLAKGASKLFFYSELIANIYILLFNVLGYKYFGLNGLGISFLISYILLLIQVFYIAYFKFNFSFTSDFIKVFTIQFILGLTSFIVVNLFSENIAYSIGSVLVVISIWYSFKELDKRMDLKSVISKVIKR